ncbi:transcription factor E3 [Oncorhynchus kisutch]|uniref:transcription factor E3 n=1 Tax=Oncorhynchus kisutch TaxID=8019 RepID=UPI00099F765F|nr:transcription factor E3 [Oncorhynchus kisutch]
MSSRVLLRQQLIREQAQEQERQEAQEQASVAQLRATDSTPANAVTLPPIAARPLSAQLPVEVLKVQTHLENPTKFQIQQSQRQQVKQHLSATLCNKVAIQTLGVSPLALSSSASEMDPSSMALHNLGSNKEELPWNLLEMNHSPGMAAPTLTVSNSCPADLTNIKREYSDADNKAWVKERQKKDNHNLIERKRRFNINDRITELGSIIPNSRDSDMRWNKGTILKASVDYIRKLQKEQQRAKEVEMRQKKLEHANHCLMLRIQELEVQAQLHGLSSPMSYGLSSDPSFLQQQHLQQGGHILGPRTGVACSQTFLSLGDAAMAQPIPTSFLSPPSSDSPVGVTIGSPLDLGSLRFAELDDPSNAGLFPGVGLGDIVMDEGCTRSPERVDPLFFVSPGASKTSSRRSSFTMEEDL